ncbi:hypothetical protein [Variovorax sp. PBL-E5]|uniref:hypothetical protein n=1 Tax=Variovorax sp. PBL-E5 TaxID=434014 RepID=UPI001319A854|nr:hypothetical protein [Variovorax sp. PBL-E5]VTU26849.1 hypothetical protein E5CHR_02280 [Variovorax sp. PBL-E5]
MTAHLLPHPLLRSASEGISPAFHHWQVLTDAYARQLEALRRREPGASAALTRISSDLAAFQKDPTHFGPLSR